jgi:hypothetical protein
MDLINVTVNNLIVNGNNYPAPTITSGKLIGEVIGSNNAQTITCRIEVDTSASLSINKKIILCLDADLSIQGTQTKITINNHKGVISNTAQLGTANSPTETIREWASNQDQLLGVINQTTAILRDFMWENILDMVRTGGFYSTWVSTFQSNSDPSSPFDVDLVRKLEMRSQENPDDPFQFHGTDVEEIISSL